MCRRIRCEQCQKPTFAGCGKHVEQVLKDVPAEARCVCNEAAKPAVVEPAASPLQPTAAGSEAPVTPVYASRPAPAGAAYSSAPSAVCAASTAPKPAKPARPSTPPAAHGSSQSSPFSSPFSSRPRVHSRVA
jgi:hypothetical protein